MNLFRALANPIASGIDALKVEAQVCLVLIRFPTLTIQRPSVWRRLLKRRLLKLTPANQPKSHAGRVDRFNNRQR